MSESGRLPTLAQRLVRHVVGVLVLAWLVAGCGIVWVASHLMQRAYDRGLVEDALLVAERVVRDAKAPGGLALRLTSDELRTVLFDTTDSIFFSVKNESGDFVAGHRGLVEAGLLSAADAAYPIFFEKEFGGERVRAAMIFRQAPVPVFVTVGQTTTERDAMFLKLVTFMLAPLAGLLLVLVFGVRRLVNSDLAPLVRLERDLLKRDSRDLSPVQVRSKVRDFIRLGDSFNSLLATIRRSVVAQREFSGNIAHELRTPLSGIRALAEYGLRDGQPHTMREQLQAIVRAQDRASRLVDQLLALSFADEVSGSLRLEAVRIDELVREVMLRFIERTDAAGIDLGASGLDEACSVVGNPALIEGVLSNLIDNACRHAFPAEDRPVSAAQRRQITVSITCRQPVSDRTARVLLSVSDNGIGLPEVLRSEVLQRWRRASRDPLLREGSGLGLAIVSEYARLLNARLALSTGENNEGLCVSLEFAGA